MFGSFVSLSPFLYIETKDGNDLLSLSKIRAGWRRVEGVEGERKFEGGEEKKRRVEPKKIEKNN